MEIRVDPILIVSSPHSAIVLKEREGSRRLEIQASPVSLYYFLMITQNQDLGRPVIHKAMVETLNMLGLKIDKVVVDDHINKMFRCSIYIKVGEQVYSKAVHVTDGVPLAIIQDCPLLVTEEMFKKSEEQASVQEIEISDEEAKRMFESIDPTKLPS